MKKKLKEVTLVLTPNAARHIVHLLDESIRGKSGIDADEVRELSNLIEDAANFVTKNPFSTPKERLAAKRAEKVRGSFAARPSPSKIGIRMSEESWRFTGHDLTK